MQTLPFYCDPDASSKNLDSFKTALKNFGISLVDGPPESLHWGESGPYFLDQSNRRVRLDWKNEWKRICRQRGKMARGPLSKALAIKDQNIIVDSTVGTGKDLLLILSFGAKIKGLERHPGLFALQFWEWQQGLNDPDCQEWRNIELNFSEAAEFSFSGGTWFFDPMFQDNDKQKKSLPRKEMVFFNQLVGADVDQVSVAESIRTKSDRLVIKRPLKAEPLLPKPKAQYGGKSVRYDAY